MYNLLTFAIADNCRFLTFAGQVTLKPIKQEEVDYIKVAVGSQRSDDATPSRGENSSDTLLWLVIFRI